MIIHNFEQGTEEWYNIRKGKLTASHAAAIASSGKGLKTYVIDVMSEYYSNSDKIQYTNSDIQRGNELESIARSVYEFETGFKVDCVGFIEYNEFIGCSPDGLVGGDGGIEIKCPNDKNYFSSLIDNEYIDSSHNWQIQMNLLITNRSWWDYVLYNPNFSKSMIIKRIYPIEEHFKLLIKGFEQGIKHIKELKAIYDSK